MVKGIKRIRITFWMYYITENEVEANFGMKMAIDAVNDAFKEYFNNTAGVDSRNRTISESSVLSTMPAYMNKYHITGFKTYVATKEGARFVVLLFDSVSSEMIAVIEANRLGQVRTGAVTALGTNILHGKCSVFSLIGSGFQAETQLEGILEIGDPSLVRVYSRTPEHGRKFVKKMEQKYHCDISFREDLRSALEGADVISCITSSKEPLISDLSFLDSYHLNIGGANVLSHREVSQNVMRSSDIVVVEHLEQALKESSEISEFVNEGGKTVEFKDVVGESQKYKGNKKTIFKTMGIGLEDIASAYHLLKNMDLL